MSAEILESLVPDAGDPGGDAPQTVEQRLAKVESELAAIYGRLNRLLLIVTAALLSEWAKLIL
jgi:hypothetical protein